MLRSDTYMRLFFLGLCTLFITLYTLMSFEKDNLFIASAVGILGGFTFGCCVIGIETLCKQLKIRTFNMITLGLFFGFLLGQTITLLIDTLLPTSLFVEYTSAIGAVKVCIYLLTSYVGMATTLQASEELAKFLPSQEASETTNKSKTFLADISALHDSRIIDLATTGIIDTHLLIPRYLVQICTDMSDSVDDSVRIKGKRCIEHLKKLEAIPSLELRYVDEDPSEIRDINQKLLILARQHNASVLTGEGSRLQKSSIEGAKTISLNDLATALKPLANSGEFLSIKIQRFGKEPHQGIGYLDDGTMVVVNGGADYLGDLIKTQVLSVKHTTSGRIIFCNTLQDSASAESAAEKLECETSAHNYFAL